MSMDYEKKYRDLVEAVKELQDANPSDDGIQKWVEDNVPELKESEDEKIRKSLIDMLKIDEKCYHKEIAWLEKQKTSEEALQYLRENHSPSQVSDFQAAMNIAVAKAYDKGYNDGLEKHDEKLPVGFYYVNSEGKKFYSDTFKYGDITLHVENQGEQKETLCDKCKKEQGSHSCSDITALGRCALEYQGEHKPTDKIEPKFHEGEWVTCEELSAAKIISIVDNRYEIELINGYKCFSPIDYIDKELHLWTIQNAKESDILASYYGVIILVKESRNSSWGYRLSYHCAVLCNGTFEHREFHVDPEKFFPATKEQRDLLFQKMKEAGYEWDADKKELKKIEQKTWSEDDEYQINTILHELDLKRELYKKEGNKVEEERYNGQYNWLKSLRPQPKQEWSEEDENRFTNLISLVKCSKENDATKEGFIKFINRLKSIGPQSTWKPSEEQMDALETAISSLQSTALESLYNELKKL